jgi:putative chitobiose transport system permease protein
LYNAGYFLLRKRGPQTMRKNGRRSFGDDLRATQDDKAVFRLIFIALAVLPFLWMISTSLKGTGEQLFTMPPQWIPQSPTLENYASVWTQLPFLQFVLNSAMVTLIATVFNLLNATLAGVVLSRVAFKGKSLLNGLILATMFIPFQVLMIPLYKTVLSLGLLDYGGRLGLWIALALPFCVSGFGVLMVKQAMDELPVAYSEAATLDGANLWQQLVFVTIPLLQPTLVTLGIFSFIAVWGDFLWSSLLTNEPETLTLTTGLVQLQGQFGSDWRLISAGTLLMLIPSLSFFLVMQRYLIAPTDGRKG